MFGEAPQYKGQGRYISIDVNGYDKRPNKLGYDLYFFQLKENGELLPMGAKGTDYTETDLCEESSNEGLNGFTCAYKVLMTER